jgi:cation transport ATPase
MTFMITASPCAVVPATMPPLLSAVANAGRHGALVKSAVVMERLGTSTVVAFGKAGTLTEGTPSLTTIHPTRHDGADGLNYPGIATGMPERQVTSMMSLRPWSASNFTDARGAGPRRTSSTP